MYYSYCYSIKLAIIIFTIQLDILYIIVSLCHPSNWKTSVFLCKFLLGKKSFILFIKYISHV